MATLTTSTATTRRLSYPAQSSVARDSRNGNLYAFFRTASTTYALYRSTDNGASWSARTGFTRSNLIEWSSLVMDNNGYIHLGYRVSDTTDDRVFYRRYAADSDAWESELQVSGSPAGTGDANGGVPGAVLQGVDIGVHRNANSSYAILVAVGYAHGTSNYGLVVCGVTIPTAGAKRVNNSLITATRTTAITGTSPGRTGVTVEKEHNGDGFTTSTPHLWITFGRTKLYLVKLAWQGSTWKGQGTPVVIDTSMPATDYVPTRWDGNRLLMSAVNSTASSTVDVFERNQANGSTTTRTTPSAHPQGAIRGHTVTYDATSKNVRVYAVGTTNATPYVIEYIRATGVWSSWAQVTTDAVSFTPTLPDDFTMRSGGNSGSARHDFVYANGTVSPFSVKNLQQTAQYNPNTPTWDTSAVPYSNGGAANVGAALTLDWTFSDTDPNDTQASYVLRRQIGAGAFAYYNAGTSTWGAGEVFNTSATSAVTLASGWGADADANHQYAVKVRDAGGFDSGFSAALTLIPSTLVNPSITAPAAAAVLTTSTVTITWTAAQQKQYRVWLVTNPGGEVKHDSGWVNDATATSYAVPYSMPDNTGWQLWLQTTNNEGLASTTQTRNFTVNFVEPPAPVLAVTPSTADGYISVAITNPAAVGTQPAVAGQTLYRRKVVSSNLLANSGMDGNVTGWAGVGGTLSYSTAQSAPGSSPGAARLVPTGAAADSQVTSTTADSPSITPGDRMTVSGWIRPDTANKSMRIQVNWMTSGGGFVAASGMTVTAPVAGAWHYLEFTADSSAATTAAKASAVLGLTGTPAAGDAFYVDDMQIRRENTDSGTAVAAAIPANSTVQDWRAAARVPYEYRAVVEAANGGVIYGPWAA